MEKDFLAQQGMHDPEWDALVQFFKERNPADRRQNARDLARIARVYRRHEHHWPEFQNVHGIVPLHRGRTAGSKFHPICRHLCGLGLRGDETGRASVLAAVLDVWEKTGTAPAEIPKWIAATKGGIRAIYEQSALDDPLDDDYEIQSDDEREFSRYSGVARARNEARWNNRGSDWATPPELFEQLNREFGPFTLDVAASKWNTKVLDNYFTEVENGLTQDWGQNRCFMNCPFLQIHAWIQKAYESSEAGARIVCIVPVNTDSRWWTDYAEKGEIRFLKYRPKFLTREGQWQQLMRPSAIVIFRPPGEADKQSESDDQIANRGNNRRNRTMNDIVYTGDVIARALIQHVRQYVKPGGKWLDPCRGPGAFYSTMPEPRSWCEITKGRDFLNWTESVACAATNPPWSDDEPNTYTRIARHAFEIADVVLLLTKISTGLGTYIRHDDWRATHGLQEVILIRWRDAEFINADGSGKSPEGIALAAFIWVRGYTGGTHWNYDWYDHGIPKIEDARSAHSKEHSCGERAEMGAAAE